ASSTQSKMRACSIIQWAPEAAETAFSFGQPSRGLTILSSLNPKFAIALIAVPIFSPSCGLTNTTTGASADGVALVLSVPAINPARRFQEIRARHVFAGLLRRR